MRTDRATEREPAMPNPRTAQEAVNLLSAAHRQKIEAAVPAEVIGAFTDRSAREAVNRMTPKHRARVERAIR